MRQDNHRKELSSGHDVPLPPLSYHDGGIGAGLDYIEVVILLLAGDMASLAFLRVPEGDGEILQ